MKNKQKEMEKDMMKMAKTIFSSLLISIPYIQTLL